MVVKTSNKVVIACVILIVALCSGHAFQAIYSWVPWLTLPIVFFVLLTYMNRENVWILDRSQVAVLVFTLMIGCTTLVYMGSGLRYNLLMLCTILAGSGLTRMYSFRKLARCYVNCMTVVTAVAIVGYLLVQNTSYLNGLPSISNVNGIEYRIAGIFNYLVYVPERNCAMFWEPGLFASHLTISMVFEIMFRKKPNFWRLALFTVGIFTANSSAGFALWFLCVILLLVKKADLKKNALAGFFGFIVLIFGLVVVLNFDKILMNTALGENEYFGKLSSDSIFESSRSKAFWHNLEMFMTAPLFGLGVVNVSKNVLYVEDISTFSYMLSLFGILGLAYTIYWVYGICRIPRVNLLAKLVLLTIAVVILNKEPHYQLLLSWGILFYLIKADYSEEEPKVKGHTTLPGGRERLPGR